MSVNPSSENFLQFKNPIGDDLKEFLTSLWDTEAFMVFLGWFTLQAFLYNVLPGKEVAGVPFNANGNRLHYKLNGFAALLVGSTIMIGLTLLGVISPTFAYDNFVGLQTATIVFAAALSCYCYLDSFNGQVLAHGGNSGIFIYDFFIGRALNPRIGNFDLKFFCELRPGLVGWMLINLSFAAAQYSKHGVVTNTMILVNLFEGWYVLDALYNEAAILTTMDITTDGFGYMLAFGDLAWVPFTYSIQGRYLVDHPFDASPLMLVAILGLQFVGYYVFRSSNSQKNLFRTCPSDPSVADLAYIKTERGTNLLAGGWWGMARHINYMGDLMMATAWCMTCGFDHAIPYFYVIYFAILLIHRERRDDEKCHNKYGKDWERYCEQVPYRIVPFVY